VNVVREDPVRKGLLYAGTELGIYVSFDDGDHWQPLQLNLPTASVRDIDVHGDDLVVATHGRSFWILDDVTALRELQPQVAQESAHLFKPQVALRVRAANDEGTPQPPETPKGDNPPQGAIIDYYVGNGASGPLTLEVVDARNSVVRHWSSEDHPQQIDPKTLDIPMYWVKPVEPISAKAGMHRWVWDMHYAAPEGVRARRRRGAEVGAWAPPGQYRVRLTSAGKSYEQTLTLKPDPRVNIPANVYTQMFDTAERALHAAAQIAPAMKQASEYRKQMDAGRKQGSADTAALDALSKRMDEVVGQAESQQPGAEPPAPTTLTWISNTLTTVAAAVDSADAPPTQEALRALDAAEKAVPAALQRWNALQPELAQRFPGATAPAPQQ
jgi:hypothetical protein